MKFTISPFSRFLLILVSMILVFVKLTGIILFTQTYDLIFRNAFSDMPPSFQTATIINLTFTFLGLGSVVSGIYLGFIAKRYKQDFWLWLLLGMVYAKFAIIFFVSYCLYNEIGIDKKLIKSLLSLFLLIVIFHLFFNALGSSAINFFLKRLFPPQVFGFLSIYKIYIQAFSIGYHFLSNIILSIIFYIHLKNKQVKPLKWVITTIFLGLLPVIVFELLNVESIKNKIGLV